MLRRCPGSLVRPHRDGALHHLFDDQAAVLTAHIDLQAERLHALQRCEQTEDMSTPDLLIELQRQADLQSYFLRSHLPGPDVAVTSMPSRDGASEDARRIEE